MAKKRICLAGEVYYEEFGILHAHIREPFYSAGKQYGWNGSTLGLGLSKAALIYALRHKLLIRVTVGNNPNSYQTSPQRWLDFARQHDAIMDRGETRLFILQWSEANFDTIRRRQIN